MKKHRVLGMVFLAVAVLCGGGSLVGVGCGNQPSLEEAPDFPITDAGAHDAARRRMGLATDPSGTGAAITVNGQLAAASVTGDAGFVLTSPGVGLAPVFAPSTGGSGFTPGGDLDGSSTAQYVVGIEGIPIDPATCRVPSSSSRMYFDGTKQTCAVPTLSGDLSGTASLNTFPGAVLSATGAAGNPYDAGGTFFVNQASGECLAGVDAGFCAQQGYVVFSDATSWQTIVERQALPNRPMDFYLIFDAWDYSGDGGSITKNNVTFSLEAHVATDSSGTPFFSPQAGADFGPGPIALAPLKNGGVSGCTTNNSDAGCTPSGGAVTTWTAQILNGGGSPPIARIQVKAVGTTHWPWHGAAMMNEQRFAP